MPLRAAGRKRMTERSERRCIKQASDRRRLLPVIAAELLLNLADALLHLALELLANVALGGADHVIGLALDVLHLTGCYVFLAHGAPFVKDTKQWNKRRAATGRGRRRAQP